MTPERFVERICEILSIVPNNIEAYKLRVEVEQFCSSISE